jgi:hypothetical protein
MILMDATADLLTELGRDFLEKVLEIATRGTPQNGAQINS